MELDNRRLSPNRFKIGNTYLVISLNESDFNLHPYTNVPRFAIDYISEHLNTLFQLYQSQDVRNILSKSGCSVLIGDCIGPHSTFTGRFIPLNIIRPAVGTNPPRVKLKL